MLKDNLRNIKNFKNLFEQKIYCNQAVSNHKWLGMLSRQEPGDGHTQSVAAEKGKYSIVYSLKLSWLFVVGF